MIISFVVPEGGRPVRPVIFASHRSAWTWISRQIRSNPYLAISVPPEFRAAALVLKARCKARCEG